MDIMIDVLRRGGRVIIRPPGDQGTRSTLARVRPTRFVSRIRPDIIFTLSFTEVAGHQSRINETNPELVISVSIFKLLPT